MNVRVKPTIKKRLFEGAVSLAAGAAISAVVYPIYQKYNSEPAPDPVAEAIARAAKANESKGDVNENEFKFSDLEYNAIVAKANLLQERLDETSRNMDHLINAVAIDAVQNGTVAFSGNIVKATVPLERGGSNTYTFNFQSGKTQEICYTTQGECKSAPGLDKQQEQDLRRVVCNQAIVQNQNAFLALNCKG